MSWDREKERKAGRAYHMGSAVFALIFAIFWCVMACAMGAWFMLIFGLPFVGMTVFRLVMLTRHHQDSPKQKPYLPEDPWDRPAQTHKERENGFCPYCGSAVEESFDFCPKCGRKLK